MTDVERLILTRKGFVNLDSDWLELMPTPQHVLTVSLLLLYVQGLEICCS